METEEKQENKNNKKRAVVFSIIAIATMLIVVAGATFAYLESSVANNGSLNMAVSTTGGSELLLISADSEIMLEVNEDNLGREDGDVEGTANANILLQTSGTETVSETLNASVVVQTNGFKYTTGACYFADEDQLDTDHNGSYEACTGADSIWTYSSSDTTGTCYYDSLEPNNTSAGYEFEDMCKENTANVWAQERVPELLFDLYEVDADEGACEADGHTYITEDGTCRLTDESLDLTMASGTILVKEGIVVSTNNKVEKAYTAKLVFANLDHNQYGNSGGEFIGKLVFERVEN